MRTLKFYSRILICSLATALVDPLVALGEPLSGELVDALDRLSPGRTIRIQVHRHGDFTGRIEEIREDSLVMTNDEGEHRLPLQYVAALWLRSGATAHASFAGAGAGAAVGLIGGMFAGSCYLWCSEDDKLEGEYLGYGAAAGAAVGLLLARSKTSWRLLYKASGYHEAMWSDCGCEPAQFTIRAERGAAPFAGPHTIIRTESTPPPDRLQLQLGPDNRGRLALTATLLF